MRKQILDECGRLELRDEVDGIEGCDDEGKEHREGDPLRLRIMEPFRREPENGVQCDDSTPTGDEHHRWAMTLTFAPVWPTGSRAPLTFKSGKPDDRAARA
jgi:hypothetical protein